MGDATVGADDVKAITLGAHPCAALRVFKECIDAVGEFYTTAADGAVWCEPSAVTHHLDIAILRAGQHGAVAAAEHGARLFVRADGQQLHALLAEGDQRQSVG